MAAAGADSQSEMSKATPNIENQAKKSRWDVDEDKKISEIVKLQYVINVSPVVEHSTPLLRALVFS
jgi:hypothetical protein